MMVICGSAIGLLLIAGCIGNKPFNPAATQPVTEVDLATTQPSYYWNQPEVASVQVLQFQSLWDACLEEARRYEFQIDRQDYRDGVIVTKGVVSKQLLEPWRRDSGTAYGVVENTMSTISRSPASCSAATITVSNHARTGRHLSGGPQGAGATIDGSGTAHYLGGGISLLFRRPRVAAKPHLGHHRCRGASAATLLHAAEA